NARGQVIAATYHTAAFFSPSARPILTPHASAADALTELAIATRNTGDLQRRDAELEDPNRLIPAAVDAVERLVPEQVEASPTSTVRLVATWQERPHAWEHEAAALIQHRSLRSRQKTIVDEQEPAADCPRLG